MNFNLFLLLIIILATTPLYALESFSGNCKTSKLDYMPYSSSILDLRSGDLTQSIPYNEGGFNQYSLDKQVDIFYKNFLIPKEISRKSFRQNIIKRFDRQRKIILNKDINLYSKIQEKNYDPNAAPWEGLCNQYTAASLNPKISKFLEGINGMICSGDTVFYRDELSELFTGLYEYENSKRMYGKRNYNTLSDFQSTMRNHLGINEFNPEQLNKYLHHHLSANIGVALDVDYTLEVWNHPIYSVTTCTDDYSWNLNDPQRTYLYIPAKHFSSQDKLLQKIINTVSYTDLAIKIELNKFKQAPIKTTIKDKLRLGLSYLGATDMTYKDRLKEIKEKANKRIDSKVKNIQKISLKKLSSLLSRLKIEFSPDKNSKTSQYIQMRTYLYENIFSDSLLNGDMELDQNYKITTKKMTITYKDYNSYAVPIRNFNDDYSDEIIEQAQLNYFFITDKQTNQKESFWSSTSTSIPDFFWIPEHKSGTKNALKTSSIKDLFNIIKECRTF